MKKYTMYVKDNGKIIVQPADYVEYGWVITIVGSVIRLFEIPFGGGDPMLIGDYDTIPEALLVAERLT